MTSPPAEYLHHDRLMALLSPREALGAMQGFFSRHRREEVEVPTRLHLNVPGANTVGLYMPAATAGHVAVKIVHLMPERRPAVEAEVFFYDAPTGKLLFWGDGKPLTALRTAAVSTAASLRLMPRCRSLLVYGAGVQAAAHLEAFASAYPDLETLHAVTRSAESFQRLRKLLPESLRDRVADAGTPPADPKGVLAAADCVVTTTPAPEPLFDWGDVRPDCHVVGVGSATPAMNEIPAQAFKECRVWVDTPAALREAGDCLLAVKQGWREEEVRGDLFDLLGGMTHSPDGPTLFKSVGHAAQDLALLIRLWELLSAEP